MRDYGSLDGGSNPLGRTRDSGERVVWFYWRRSGHGMPGVTSLGNERLAMEESYLSRCVSKA